MNVERETVVEIAVSVVAVAAFVVAILLIGVAYTENGNLDETGALALVGAIVAFIFLMAGVGLFLSRRSS